MTTGFAGGLLLGCKPLPAAVLTPTDTSDICKLASQPQMLRDTLASLVQRVMARRMP